MAPSAVRALVGDHPMTSAPRTVRLHGDLRTSIDPSDRFASAAPPSHLVDYKSSGRPTMSEAGGERDPTTNMTGSNRIFVVSAEHFPELIALIVTPVVLWQGVLVVRWGASYVSASMRRSRSPVRTVVPGQSCGGSAVELFGSLSWSLQATRRRRSSTTPTFRIWRCRRHSIPMPSSHWCTRTPPMERSWGRPCSHGQPQVGATPPMPGWLPDGTAHSHQSVLSTASGVVVGTQNGAGICPAGSTSHVTQPMICVWLAPLSGEGQLSQSRTESGAT